MKIINRLKHLIWLSIFLLVIPSISFSDGIYVTQDLKHVTSEHTIIKLSKRQIEDVERLRTVELTEDQLKPLKKIYNKIPKKFTIVSSRWDTCTCDMGIYAIWCRKGELDIPHSAINAQKQADEYAEKNPTEEFKEEEYLNDENNEYISEKTIIDSKGYMFIDGKVITEEEMYAVIDGISQKQSKATRVYRSIYLDIPPPISSKIDNEIKELVERLESYSQSKGISFWALGLSYEKSIRKRK